MTFKSQNAQKRKRKSSLCYRKKKGRKGSDVASFLDSTSDDENGNRRSSRIRDAPPPPPPSPIQLSNDIADCNDCASLDSIDNCLCSIYEIFSRPQELRRQYIAMHFVLKYGGCSDSKETRWDGKGGIMSSIRRDLAIPPGVDIRYILEDVRRCKNSGTKYNGTQKEGAGRVSTLSTDSVEAQIVADELEGGSSQRIAWGAVNVYRESLHLDEVTFSVVYTLIQNMKPKSVRIDTHRQGSNNELSRICRARKAWCTQLCVRLGLVDYREVMRKDGIADEVPIPKWYDQQKLTSIKIDQIAFWDETHKKVKPGNTAAYDQDEVLTFPRDANGKVDLENGTYQEVQLAKLQCKYTDEVRLCIGVSVGNSPELMPLDNSLNRDIHTAVQKHIAMTNTLDDDDSRKFSLSTPKKGTVAYLKILNSGCAPREERIIQDVFKFEGACLLIMELDGKILNDRTDYGRRVAIESTTKEKTRGGKRERKLDDNRLNKKKIKEMTTHPDAMEGSQEKIEASLQTYESVNVEFSVQQQNTDDTPTKVRN
jgi:hypothetical protein